MSDTFPYEDIIGLERPVSKAYPQASMEDRAARFSPFAAITGYEAMVQEAARSTQPRVELDENRKAVLDERLRQSIGQRVTVTYFVPDPKKEGGSYQQVTEQVIRLDAVKRQLILPNMVIPIDDIFDIEK